MTVSVPVVAAMLSTLLFDWSEKRLLTDHVYEDRTVVAADKDATSKARRERAGRQAGKAGGGVGWGRAAAAVLPLLRRWSVVGALSRAAQLL